MKSEYKFFVIMSFALFFLGCNTIGVGVQGPGPAGSHRDTKYHKQGPPPHAPAHGYRHKHQHGHEMRYDSDIGAYVVLNVPETYFGNNFYIRLSTDGRWLVSTTLDSGWRLAAGTEIPPKLKMYKEKQSYQKKGKKWKSQKKKSKQGKGHWKNRYEDDEDY